MKIAAAQLHCVPGDVVANARQVASLAEQARAQDAELVVFPELALTGYELEAVRRDPGLWLSADDPRLDVVRASGIATVVNCAVATSGPRPAVGTLVFGADGELVTTYGKQHLYEQEQDVFSAGDRDGRFELGGLRFSLATCYDNHFPELTARAAADDCQVHLASSLYGTGSGVEERAAVYPGIARDAHLYVVLANHVGRAGEWTGCGRAALWAPGGALVAEGDDRTTTVVIGEVSTEGLSRGSSRSGRG
ncbi:carbon-nitrogen hydrolase family protein [Streptomyces sp. H39-S7]|uniref:carbon-nitrogen hydrolase family protein n=1 Tax=Streptomyces sp. H39-S7 TaxID=3004357 RepID=UPI0022B078ED|nr:carbon-nitrogen hydrolase family protein [Streptomyces sp. H39-S7]MCZ4120957.1 carbon-nitrogen hydrolase family protein [Streptomyces sp. H39-S7]